MSRVAIVTGAASGIGRATAERLASQGVRVAALDKNPIDSADVLGVTVDISNEASVNAAVAQVRAELGLIDVLVNAAGMAAGGEIDGPNFVDVWHETLDVNLTGAMLLVRACMADLVREGAGRIVNVASTEALTAARRTTPYTVSKHALLGFTRSLAVELGGRGVTANCVCPGATLTGMTALIPEESRNTFARRRIPTGRYGRPEEIAYMIVSLTAPEASFVNGAVITVDGGMTARG